MKKILIVLFTLFATSFLFGQQQLSFTTAQVDSLLKMVRDSLITPQQMDSILASLPGDTLDFSAADVNRAIARSLDSMYTKEEIDQLLEGDSLITTADSLNMIIANLRGGTTGQVPKKDSNNDFDFSWSDDTGGGGDTTHLVAFTSVIGLQDTVDELQSLIAALSVEGNPDVPYLWALSQPDTVGTIQDPFTAVTDATVSTRYESNIVGMTSDPDYAVYLAYVDSGQYRVKYDLRGTPTWSDWFGSSGYFKDVDSLQVRHYSSSSNSTETTNTLYIGNDSETFSITTEVGVDAPTNVEAINWTTASGGFSPDDLSPSLNLTYSSGVTKSGSNTAVSWTDGTWTFTDPDTSSTKVVATDTSLYFNGGGAFELNDASGHPLDIGTNDISIEVWFYEPDLRAFNTITTKDGINILNNNGYFTAAIYYDSSSVNIIDASIYYETVAADNWHHAVFTFDRNVGAKLYINNVLQTTESTVEWTDSDGKSINNTSPMYLVTDFVGHIAAFRVYPSVLTVDDVDDLYNYGRQ